MDDERDDEPPERTGKPPGLRLPVWANDRFRDDVDPKTLVSLPDLRDCIRRHLPHERDRLRARILGEGQDGVVRAFEREDGSLVIVDGEAAKEILQEADRLVAVKIVGSGELDLDQWKRWRRERNVARRHLTKREQDALIDEHLDSPERAEIEDRAAARQLRGKAPDEDLAAESPQGPNGRHPTADQVSAAMLGTTEHQIKRGVRRRRGRSAPPSRSTPTNRPLSKFLKDRAETISMFDEELIGRLKKQRKETLAKIRGDLLHLADQLERAAAHIRERVGEEVVTTAAMSGTTEE